MASILVIGPHPDDQELGMGGTIIRLASQGHDVCVLDLTNGEPTPHGSPSVRAAEAAESIRLLRAAAASANPHAPGTSPGRIHRRALDLPNRSVQHTIEARHKVAGVIRAVQAQIVFLPYFEDAHPDHLAATRIVEDARFDAKLTGLAMPGDEGKPPLYPKWMIYYFATHLRIVPSPTFLIDTTGLEAAKRDAILAYRSQFVINEKNRAVVDWVDAAGRYFGSRIGAASAEPFFTREPLGLSGLGQLLV